MRRGLVFGKFLPLHRGHQFVIDRAFAECDDVTIVVYDDKPEGEYPPMPIKKRLGWMEMLYPQAENIVALKNPITDESDDPKWAGVYAEQMAPLGKFDRVFTSEPQYQNFADCIGAEHIIVDPKRTSVRVSGTKIRSDPYLYRGFLDPRVYASLIRKVVFVGTESTGKTTLARRMADEYGTLWVHEFGRELWEAQDLKGSFADHLKMATRQRAREEAMCRHAKEFLFCDTNAWTTLMWSMNTYEYADHRLRALADSVMDDYIWVLCGNDFGWVQDGTRELEGTRSWQFHQMQYQELDFRKVKYYEVHGDVETRVQMMRKVIERERTRKR